MTRNQRFGITDPLGKSRWGISTIVVVTGPCVMHQHRHAARTLAGDEVAVEVFNFEVEDWDAFGVGLAVGGEEEGWRAVGVDGAVAGFQISCRYPAGGAVGPEGVLVGCFGRCV